MDAQVPFLPSVEVSIKALVVTSVASIAAAPTTAMQVLFCAHHPYIVGTARRDVVWRVYVLFFFFLSLTWQSFSSF